MDWIQSIGLADLATEFFQKLSAAVNLLATPKETLLQVRGRPFLLVRVLCLFVLLTSPRLTNTPPPTPPNMSCRLYGFRSTSVFIWEEKPAGTKYDFL